MAGIAHLVGQAFPDAGEAFIVGGLLLRQERGRIRRRQLTPQLRSLRRHDGNGVLQTLASLLVTLQMSGSLCRFESYT